MFFILSKILLFALIPFNWVMVCLVWAVLTKKVLLRKRLLITATVVFLLFSNYWLYSVCVRAWQPKVEHVQHNKTYAAGILLCGMTLLDKEQEQFFGNGSDRFYQAYRLYKTGIIQKIFVSGGSGSLIQTRPKEADFLKKELLALGVPDSSVIVEHFSKNTYESAVMAKRYLDSLKIAGPYILVTSAEHMPRSLLCFEKAGIKVEPHPADYKVVNGYMGFEDYVVPNIAVLAWWKTFLKEVVGTWIYKVTGKA